MNIVKTVSWIATAITVWGFVSRLISGEQNAPEARKGTKATPRKSRKARA